MNDYTHVKSYRQRQKENIIYVMGGKCAICGYQKCNAALELHHLDPNEKEFTVAQNTNRAWEHVVKELPKTVLLCANCHRELHQGLIDNDSLISNFNLQRANEISEQVKLQKRGVQNHCLDCGKIIDKRATYCVECCNKHRQTVKRPSREQLKYDIRNLPMIKVGEKYGVSDNSIRKWCDSMNLPRKVSEIKTYTDEEWEQI